MCSKKDAEMAIAEHENRLCELADRYPSMLDRIPQSPAICLAAVKSDGLALQHVRKKTHEICMAAVKQNGLALEFVEDQTHDICEAAIESCAGAIRHVKEQTPDLCRKAVTKRGTTIMHVLEQTDEICELAVRQDPMAFHFVKRQTPKIAWLAVRQDPGLEYLVDRDILRDWDIIESIYGEPVAGIDYDDFDPYLEPDESEPEPADYIDYSEITDGVPA